MPIYYILAKNCQSHTGFKVVFNRGYGYDDRFLLIFDREQSLDKGLFQKLHVLHFLDYFINSLIIL